jgi:hypothetical protein
MKEIKAYILALKAKGLSVEAIADKTFDRFGLTEQVTTALMQWGTS